MIDNSVNSHHLQNVERLTKIDVQQAKIEARIIGIDGNGTGREGALQRQDKELLLLKAGQFDMNIKLDTLLHRSSYWSKKGFWTTVRWGIPTIIALLSLMLAYFGYRAASNKPVASIPIIRETLPADASN